MTMLTWHLPSSLNELYGKESDLYHLFWSRVGRKVSIIFLQLFSPIYIFQIAKDLNFTTTEATIGVIAYYLLMFVFKFMSLPIAENVSQRIGFKGMIWASAIPFFVYIPSIIFASSYPILLVVSAISFGIHAGFFWWGYHGYFTKTAEKYHFGRRVGESRLFETIASFATPFTGALIVNYLGFTALFITSAVIVFVSFLLLGKNHDKRQKRDVRFFDVLKLVKKHKSVSLAYFGYGGEYIMYSAIWPLFLFLFFGQVISLGVIVSLSSLAAATFAIFVGDWVDKQGERKAISIGSPLVVTSWIIRALGGSISSFVLADSIWNFGQRLVSIPLDALAYRKAQEAESAKGILFRMIAVNSGVIVGLLFISVWVYFTGNLKGSFVIVAIIAALPLVAVLTKRIHDKKA